MTEPFDHENLEVHPLEPQFLNWGAELLVEVRENPQRHGGKVDQLDRASLSALLNAAEGIGKRDRKGRATFLDDARGSATRHAGCWMHGLPRRSATTQFSTRQENARGRGDRN